MTRFAVCQLAIVLLLSSPCLSQDRPTKVRNDRQRVESEGFWIYNDLPRGIREAEDSGKPLVVVFRCIPCEACAKLDEQVVERDPVIQDLLAQFVCVRIVHANGMDLSLFQFDYDQSWAAFFLNPDLTIYGRYGTRSHQTESDHDVSLEGFAASLSAALALHQHFPDYKSALAGKRGPASSAKVPENLPSLKGKYKSTLDYEGQVVQSCIHCHQVGESLRQTYRLASQPIPERMLYPYPNPKILGLVMDPKQRSTVLGVSPGSSAERDGFQSGDEIVTLAKQPLVSIADIQWVLHNAGDTGTLTAGVRRQDKLLTLQLTLEKGWRRHDNISWRATSWDLRRMTTGGLVFDDLSDADRDQTGLPTGSLALLVKHVGQYGAHAAGKQAGFQQGDIVVAADGHTNRMTESALMTYLVNDKKPGDRVPMTVLRDGERLELALPIQ